MVFKQTRNRERKKGVERKGRASLFGIFYVQRELKAKKKKVLGRMDFGLVEIKKNNTYICIQFVFFYNLFLEALIKTTFFNKKTCNFNVNFFKIS